MSEEKIINCYNNKSEFIHIKLGIYETSIILYVRRFHIFTKYVIREYFVETMMLQVLSTDKNLMEPLAP
jgi:hypothetical protein